MTLMTVNNHHEQGKDHRSQPRWSAVKKTDAVLRLLGGEPLEELSRELKVEAHRLAAWRDDPLAAGKQGLKGQRADRTPEDRALKQAERKIGQLTMENEVLRAAVEKRGLQIPPAKPPRWVWSTTCRWRWSVGCSARSARRSMPAARPVGSQADPDRCHRSAIRSCWA